MSGQHISLAGDAEPGPPLPGRIASALRHFLAASSSVAVDDGESPTEAAGRGSAALRRGVRPARAARLRLTALPSPTQLRWVPGLGREDAWGGAAAGPANDSS